MEPRELKNIEEARTWLVEMENKPLSKSNIEEMKMYLWLKAYDIALRETLSELETHKKWESERRAEEDLRRSW